jgi:hypothetical protein
MPYPIAAEIPEINPWSRSPRGNSDGVSDRQNRATAPATPTKL